MNVVNTIMTCMQDWKLTKKFLVSILLVLAVVMTIMVIVLSIHPVSYTHLTLPTTPYG